jgi:hypothetical protein
MSSIVFGAVLSVIFKFCGRFFSSKTESSAKAASQNDRVMLQALNAFLRSQAMNATGVQLL